MIALTRNGIVAAALAASAILSVGAANFGTPQATAAESSPLYCQGYAQEAQRRYRDYRCKRCGNLVNIVWNSDYGTHYSYCMRNSQSTTEWLKTVRYRYLSNGCVN
jgi:hypothetical protein